MVNKIRSPYDLDDGFDFVDSEGIPRERESNAREVRKNIITLIPEKILYGGPPGQADVIPVPEVEDSPELRRSRPRTKHGGVDKQNEVTRPR